MRCGRVRESSLEAVGVETDLSEAIPRGVVGPRRRERDREKDEGGVNHADGARLGGGQTPKARREEGVDRGGGIMRDGASHGLSLFP